ncbi:HDOD domain-containing protein [Desulfosediminicola flagellatus]|uniref:HDOD domain-containing protein n=1 Tax=Desulfosediminicola flagellatus TaxID=2569541 RepID=UPI0010AD89A6|nr:HDOD domain-containing protein [Desulfosediminicola flagellatus]
MTSSKLATIVRQIDNFPALPATVNKVMEITSSSESTAKDLMLAILPDQSMCTTILKIANSAFFGIPRQVSTIERAVVVLGHAEIRNIVLGKAVFTSFQKLQKQDRQTTDLFWEHSFTCGLASKIIAEHLGFPASEMFIAGLIHDIGKLAMLMTFPQDYSLLFEISEPHQFRTVIHEHEEYSTSHDEIGMKILKRWLFPTQLIAATGYHHNPEQAPSDIIYPLVVQLADMLSLMHCNPDNLEPSDIVTIFDDFLPECKELWLKNNLRWESEMLGQWFAQLQEQRKRDQAILDIMMS